MDPLAREYPWYTPYQYAGNKPIRFIDRDGAEEWDNSGTFTPYIKPLPITGANKLLNFITNNTVIALYNSASGLINAVPATVSYLNTPGNSATTAVVGVMEAIDKDGRKVDDYYNKTSLPEMGKDAIKTFTKLENYNLTAQVFFSYALFKAPSTTEFTATPLLDEVAEGGTRRINYLEGDLNCAGCAQAGDATLKGNASSALNHGVTSTTDVMKHFGAKSWSIGNTVKSLSAKLSSLGEGATGVIFGSRGTGQIGHFFNITVQDGKVLFLDFQKKGSAIMTEAELAEYKDLWYIDTTVKKK